MSYCRFGRDSDVYVYGDGRGFTTHVGAFKHQSWKAGESWEQMAATRVPIGLPLDGCDYHDRTRIECAARLQILSECGYKVPRYALDRLFEEAAGVKP